MRRELITGITGQDGSYLTELLQSKGSEVHGLIRRASTFNTCRIGHMCREPHDPDTRLLLHDGDPSNSEQLTNPIYSIRPREIYNLGAQSHVMVRFDMPEYTGDISGFGSSRLLEAIRRGGIKSRFYQISSAEISGNAPAPQIEQTPFCPRSSYAAAKLYVCWMTANYHEGYWMCACSGIPFDRESSRRGETFVTRKITMGCLMIQQEEPENYVMGTGEAHSVEEFHEEASS